MRKCSAIAFLLVCSLRARLPEPARPGRRLRRRQGSRLHITVVGAFAGSSPPGLPSRSQASPRPKTSCALPPTRHGPRPPSASAPTEATRWRRNSQRDGVLSRRRLPHDYPLRARPGRPWRAGPGETMIRYCHPAASWTGESHEPHGEPHPPQTDARHPEHCCQRPARFTRQGIASDG